MVTMLPWVFPLLPAQPEDRHQPVLANITAVQDRRLAARLGAEYRANRAAHDVLRLTLPSN